MTEKYYKAINWNDIEDRVDKSAWARLNDIIWEPRHVPVSEDKKEFLKLAKPVQEALLLLQRQQGLPQLRLPS